MRWPSNAELLRDDKPWFCSSKSWPQFQFDAISRALDKPNWDESFDGLAFLLLNRAKPALLTDEHWEKLKKQASKSVEATLSRVVSGYVTKSKLIDLLSRRKPDQLPHDSWNKFSESITDRLKSILVQNQYLETQLVELLSPESNVLLGIPSDIASEIYSEGQKKYFSMVMDRILRSTIHPSREIEGTRLDLLTPSQKESIQNRVAKLTRVFCFPPDWTTKGLKAFIEAGQPEWMPDYEFKEIQGQVEKLSLIESEQLRLQEDSLKIAASQKDLAQKQNDLAKGQALVSRQLALIHDVLTDPSAVDRIESHDQIFAPGNQTNLQKVATILRGTR